MPEVRGLRSEYGEVIAMATMDLTGPVLRIFSDPTYREGEIVNTGGEIVNTGLWVNSPDEADGIPAFARILGKAAPATVRRMKKSLEAHMRAMGRPRLPYARGTWYVVLED